MNQSDPSDLSDFQGLARLFPLPNFVLLPHAVNPLHIFEKRYRQMTADALASDNLIALVLLKPGWEPDYEGNPQVHDIACLARIVNHQRLPDGKFNLLVRGLCRVHFEEELPSKKLYRTARGQPLPDPPHPESPEMRAALAEAARAWLPPQMNAMNQLQTLLTSDFALGALCDILAFALPLTTDVKQAVLEELEIARRAEHLLEVLRTTLPPEQLPMPREKMRFPPDFSTN